jgi:hypothetical protein
MMASKAALLCAGKPLWIKLQKWFMASVLAGLAFRNVTSCCFIANYKGFRMIVEFDLNAICLLYVDYFE